MTILIKNLFLYVGCLHLIAYVLLKYYQALRDRRDRDRMVGGFTTTYETRARTTFMARCTRYIIIVCQWLVTGRCISPGPAFSSTSTTDRHDITEILLKVALNTISQHMSTKYWSHSTSWRLCPRLQMSIEKGYHCSSREICNVILLS